MRLTTGSYPGCSTKCDDNVRLKDEQAIFWEKKQDEEVRSGEYLHLNDCVARELLARTHTLHMLPNAVADMNTHLIKESTSKVLRHVCFDWGFHCVILDGGHRLYGNDTLSRTHLSTHLIIVRLSCLLRTCFCRARRQCRA